MKKCPSQWCGRKKRNGKSDQVGKKRFQLGRQVVSCFLKKREREPRVICSLHASEKRADTLTLVRWSYLKCTNFTLPPCDPSYFDAIPDVSQLEEGESEDEMRMRDRSRLQGRMRSRFSRKCIGNERRVPICLRTAPQFLAFLSHPSTFPTLEIQDTSYQQSVLSLSFITAVGS